MSLGSLFTKRGKAAIIARLPSAPREPLSFLYPPWTRTSSSSTSASTSTSTSTSTATPASDHNVANLSSVHHEFQTNFSARKQSANNAGQQDSFSMERSSGGTEGLRENAPKTRQMKTTWDSLSKARKVIEGERKAKEDAEHRHGTRMAYQAYLRKQKGSQEPDWREILSDLIRHTPNHTQWLDKALVIMVPEDAVATLLYGIDDNMWDIGAGYECAIELQDRHSTDGHAKFLLSGSATAISRTAAHLLRIAPLAEIDAAHPALRPLAGRATQVNTSSNINTDGLPGPRDGKARYTRQREKPALAVTRADKIPRPKEWSKQTFADYVENLTSSKIPNHLHRLMYKGHAEHVSSVVEILRTTFLAPECRASLTREAFHMALTYFERTWNIDDARVFFVHMEMMKIPMTTETFNILLRGTAKNEDLHNFHFILHLMLKRDISPNSKTWIAFLMAIRDLKVKLYTWSKMKEAGLLRHRSTIKDACENIVSNEISTSLDNGQSQEEFLRYMDSRYGPSWLTTDGSARIIHVLGGRGLISRCWDFLYVIHDRQLKINDYCINTTLNHCKQGDNVMGAIEFLRCLPPFVKVEPDEMTYHVLFELAWRSKCYNLAKVVWRYACLNAATTRRMRGLVFTSLRNSHLMNEPDQNARKFFQRSAGQFISSNMDYLNHPAVFIQREFKNLNGFEMLEDPFKLHIPEKSKLRKNLPAEQPHSPTPNMKDSESSEENEPIPSAQENLDVPVDSGHGASESFDRGNTISSEAEAVEVAGIPEINDAENSKESEILCPGAVPIHLEVASEIRNNIYSHHTRTHPPEQQQDSTLPRSSLRNILNFINHESQVFQWWRPTRPLAEMMLEAWEMDQEWSNPQDYEKQKRIRDIQWKLDNSISIPIRAHIGSTPVEMVWG